MPAEIKFLHGFLEQVNSLAEGFDAIAEQSLAEAGGIVKTTPNPPQSRSLSIHRA